MILTPGAAALFGAGIAAASGIVGALGGVYFNHRAERSRVREARLWDREVRAYEELLLIADHWREVRGFFTTGLRFEGEQPPRADPDEAGYQRLFTQLAMFASEAVRTEAEELTQQDKAWFIAHAGLRDAEQALNMTSGNPRPGQVDEIARLRDTAKAKSNLAESNA